MSGAAVLWLNVHTLNMLHHKNCKDHSARVVHMVVKALIYKRMDTVEFERVHHLPLVDFFSLPFCSIDCLLQRCSSWISSCWKVAAAFLPDRAKPNGKAVVEITAPLFQGAAVALCCSTTATSASTVGWWRKWFQRWEWWYSRHLSYCRCL